MRRFNSFIGVYAAAAMAGFPTSASQTLHVTAQTNAVDPNEPPPAKTSRQVRRQMERRAAKASRLR